MQVAQRQLAVEVQERQAHPAQDGAVEGPRGRRRGRERSLVGPGWPAGPAGGHRRPEPLVHREGLLVREALAPHPVDRLPVERIQRVHGPLAPGLQHVPVDPGQPDGHPGAGVRVVLEPAGRGRQGAVGPWVPVIVGAGMGASSGCRFGGGGRRSVTPSEARWCQRGAPRLGGRPSHDARRRDARRVGPQSPVGQARCAPQPTPDHPTHPQPRPSAGESPANRQLRGGGGRGPVAAESGS